ncbi:MAG TPA: hypothetical protein V6C89_21845 [Drouetiella sp.]
MTYQKIDLAEDEELVRLFFRVEDGAANQFEVTDFERRPRVNEGGLSFNISRLITFKDIVAPKRKADKWRFGLGAVSAGLFLNEGYTFMYDPDHDKTHVCLHCPSCDLQEENCLCIRPAICPMDKEENDFIRQIMALYMQVLIPAQETKETLLKIFGDDVDQSDINRANQTYLQRWSARIVPVL